MSENMRNCWNTWTSSVIVSTWCLFFLLILQDFQDKSAYVSRFKDKLQISVFSERVGAKCTHLAHSFEETDDKQCDVSAEISQRRSQQRQDCCPTDAETHQNFASELLSQRSSEDLRRCIAVEERAQD